MLSLEETSKIDVNGLLKILHISSSDIRPGACVYHKKRQLLFISCQVSFDVILTSLSKLEINRVTFYRTDGLHLKKL